MGSFGLDLGTGGEGDEWVAGVVWLVYWVVDVTGGNGETDVKVMERRPPPAPARAWAMLSPCWAVVLGLAIASLCIQKMIE